MKGGWSYGAWKRGTGDRAGTRGVPGPGGTRGTGPGAGAGTGEGTREGEGASLNYVVPDAVGVVEGWKGFQVTEAGGLVSPQRRTLWPWQARLVATCPFTTEELESLFLPGPHEVVCQNRCKCGIHIAKNVKWALPYLVNHSPFLPRFPAWDIALVQVQGWGRVVPCEHGWRTQYAYPSVIYTIRYHEQLRNYGVPVHELDDFPDENVLRSLRMRVADRAKRESKLTTYAWSGCSRARTTSRRRLAIEMMKAKQK
jgi:hypothetical protein